MTYTRRKLFWLLACLYILFFCLDVINPRRTEPLLWRETQVRWLPRQEFDGVTAFLDWPATDNELRELRSLTIMGRLVVPSDQIGANGKPALTLKEDSDITPAHLTKLAKCIHLNELHWHSVFLTPEIGATLASLPNLRHLELSLIGSPVPSLEALPSLSQLRFFKVPQVPSAELGLLARHPLLTTVEIYDSVPLRPLPGTLNVQPYEIAKQPATLHEAVQIERLIIKQANEHSRAVYAGVPYNKIPVDAMEKSIPVSESLWSDLAKLPNLKAVEIRDGALGWPVKLNDDAGVRSALAKRPEVAINPIVRDLQSTLSPFHAFSAALVLVTIGMQLFSQFGSGWSRTVPAFASPHLLVAGAILLIHLSIATAILYLCRDVAILTAISLAVAFPALGSLFVAIASRRPALFPFLFPVAFALMMGIVVGIPLYLPHNFMSDLLDGRLPGVAVFAIIGEAALFIWSAQSLTLLPRRLSEAAIPMGLGLPQTLQHLQMQRLRQPQSSGRFPAIRWRMLDSRIESFLASKDHSDRRKQWRAGEPAGWQNLLPLCVFMPWIVVGTFTFTMLLLGQQSITPELFVFYSVLLGTLSLALATLVLAGGSQSRRPLLPQELLRPMLRKEMETHVRFAIWADLRPLLLLTFVYLLALAAIHSWGPPGWSFPSWSVNTLGHALLCLALPLPIWAGLLWLLTISKEMWRVFLVLVGYFLLFGLCQTVVLAKLLSFSSTTIYASIASYTVAGICLMLGALLAWLAHRRLPNVEWGRTG